MLNKTNYEMLMELEKEYSPKQRGIISMDEIYKVNEVLSLDKMNVIELRNMRDITVMWYGMKFDETDKMEYMDKMSAVTAVIDNKILNKGGEV